MFRYDVTIYSSFLGLILYAGLIGTVHPAIILLLLVLSVLQFLSYRRAALTKSAAETICLKLKYRSAISRNSRTTHPPERISVCIS